MVKYGDAHSTLTAIKSGVPQSSVLGPILYLIYTADLPTNPQTMVATFADDTAILASHENPERASEIVQYNISILDKWLQKWRIRANGTKSNHVTFTMNRETCPPIVFSGQLIPQVNEVKYLGMHLDRRLTWKKHIQSKRKQLNIKFSRMYWLLGHRSSLSVHNKLLIYKAILKPVWTYGI